jgi:hypothetical protein
VAAAQQPVSVSDESHHHFVLENQFFRVYTLELAPQSRTQSYTCEHDCLLLPLYDSELLDNTDSLRLRKGEPWWLATHVTHSLINHSGAVFQAIAIENLAAQLDRSQPKCGCKPAAQGASGVGCGCGVGSGLVADGASHWMHAQTHGQVTVETYGLQPTAIFISKDRTGPLPEMQIQPGASGELLVAVDDFMYRMNGSERVSILPSGEAMWVQQQISIHYPEPPDCSWSNFLVDGKVSSTCKTSVFVLIKPQLPAANSTK